MMKKSFAFLLVAFLLAACGDDDTSFAPRNDESSSNIEEESSSSVTPKSSEDETSVSSNSAKSSSSVTPQSSSSETSVSSSSAKSSSSVTPKSSSSSTSVSSSSEYKPYNHQKVFSSDSLLSGAYKEFTDERNGRKYYYLTINGENQNGETASVTVMAENLNIGFDVLGTDDQNDDSKIERYCYNDDTTNCDKYGGLYQWAEAMQLPFECNSKSCADLIKPNHQGICPDGWRLLTYDDYYIVVHADGNKNGVKDVRAMSFGGLNYSGYSLIGGGMRITPSGGFKQKDDVAYWFYPGEKEYENYAAGDDGYLGKSDQGLNTNVSYKQNGLSIRCVKLETETASE